LISTELKPGKNYFFFLAAFFAAFFGAFLAAFLAAFFLVAMCGSPPSGWVQIRNVEQNKTGKWKNGKKFRRRQNFRNARIYWLSRDQRKRCDASHDLLPIFFPTVLNPKRISSTV
jgi:hypothetical protein